MDIIAEIRRLHFVEHESISALAQTFKLSRPTIRKHLKTVEEPVYLRKTQVYQQLGSYIEQLNAWLDKEASLPRKQKRTPVCFRTGKGNDPGQVSSGITLPAWSVFNRRQRS
ncbi:hypothetical protein RP726_06275 [Candidatus Methylospira mobilis]|uniref:hypothetical protein n=1 Tax=Candidatus Methylospira mobilis TaxID=1808979 RepID=UPI0028E7B34F|nr:hypothetical protein [Candidatus Methylospira mobilis]WNV06019.1 hypothetical protein RP726_06275 [Candidatus Methylospira mobilis]